MKKLLIYVLGLSLSLNGCKKSQPVEDIQDPPGETTIPAGPDGKGGSIRATADIYLFGKNGSPTFNYVLWGEDVKFEKFVDYPLDAMAIEGLFIQGNRTNGERAVNFFGSHLVGPNKYRISYFSKNKYYHLSESLKVPISPNFTEGFIAYAFYQKSLYMLAHGVGDGTMQYYYKITSSGDFSYHSLLPNIDYEFIAGSNAGAVLCVPEVKLLSSELMLYRDKNLIGSFDIADPAYSFITPLDMQMFDENTVFFTSSARRDVDGTLQYLYFTINLNSREIRLYPATDIPSGATIGNAVVDKGKVYLPVTDPVGKACYYLAVSFGASGAISTSKNLLETPGTKDYHADQLFIGANDVYVQGGEGQVGCYWKNNKLVRLQQGGVGDTYLYDIRK